VRDLAQMDAMAEVARFCRARQPYCHRSEAVPQVALLYSRAGHYRESDRLFSPSGSTGVEVLRRTLKRLVGAQQSVQVVGEHHLEGRMARWPLIVVPGWAHLEPPFRDELAAYAAEGGRLLLVGEGPAALFAGATNASVTRVASADEVPGHVASLFTNPLARVTGCPTVDVSVRRLGGRLAVHLVNTSGAHDARDGALLASIPPAGPLQVELRLERKPGAVVAQPEGVELPVTWTGGVARVTLPALPVYTILDVR
jgi:hypothetical protein